MIRSFGIFLFFLIAFQPNIFASSDSAKVKVEVDKAFATVGDRINFRVTVTHPPKATVFSIDAREVLQDFEVKEVTDFSTKEEENIIEGKNYVLTNYKLGEYVIRPFAIQYRTETGETKELKTNNLYITIESVDKNKPEGSDIRGVKGIRKIKGRFWLWFLVLTLLATGSGLIFFVYRKKEALTGKEKEPLLSPHDEAYQALNRLQHSDLIRRGHLKLYFFQMSEILRHYFERRYAIKALESTTVEVLRDLKEQLSSEQIQLIDEALSFCDLAKFAKYEPTPLEILRQNNQAKLVIDQTREIAVQEEPAPVAAKAN